MNFTCNSSSRAAALMRITPFSFDENTSPRQSPACVILITPPYVMAGCSGSSTTRFLPAAAKSSAHRSSRRQLGRVMYVGVRHTIITLAEHSASLNRRTTSSTFCTHASKHKRQPSRAHSTTQHTSDITWSMPSMSTHTFTSVCSSIPSFR